MTTAIIVHSIPGRIRLRIPDKQGNISFFSNLSDDMREIVGVHDLHVNPATGSLVMRFDEDEEQLLLKLNEQIPDFVVEKNYRSKNSRSMRLAPLKVVSGREITPMFVLGSTLAAFGVVQAIRGRIAVPSITAFWYALEAFRQSSKKQ